MLFSELAKRVAEKYPEVKTAYPMDCELSNVELYDPSGAVPPVDTLGIYTARQIGQDMTLPLCFVCAGTPDQPAHDKIAYSDSNYIIIPQVSAVDVVYYIMSLFGDSFKQQKLYSNLIYMLLNGADLTSVFCEFSKGTGSQLLAIDISGKVLAYSKPFMVNHPHWIHSIEVGYLDNYLIEYILSYRVKHKMDMSPNTFVLFCNRLQMYIKVIRVIADNEIIGYVFMGNYTGEFPWFSDKLMHLLAKKPALHPARQPQLQHLPLQHAPERAQRHHRWRQRGGDDPAHQRRQADLPAEYARGRAQAELFQGQRISLRRADAARRGDPAGLAARA